MKENAIETEAELIARCQRGGAEAWDALFDKYYAIVARFVFQLSGDFSHEDTEEICQETFLAMVRNLGSFQGEELLPNLAPADRREQGDGFSRQNADGQARWERRTSRCMGAIIATNRRSIRRRQRPGPMPFSRTRRRSVSLGKVSIGSMRPAARSSSCVITVISVTPKSPPSCDSIRRRLALA